jgi:hypothetical protein
MVEEKQENKVSIILDTILKEYAGQKAKWEITVEDSVTIKELLGKIGVPSHAVGFVLLKGEMINLDREVQNGDSYNVYPLLNGG